MTDARARILARVASSSQGNTAKGGDEADGGGDEELYPTTTSPASLPLGLDPRPLPSWLTELRPHQADAITQILDEFTRSDVVFVEAPTGSGKTIIGEMVRRYVGKGLYVCSGLDLQDQFVRDFDYASVMKGRSNYPTLLRSAWPEVTAADCDKDQGGCTWCGEEVNLCPYEVAKGDALGNDLAALNTTYALYEWNYVGGMGGRDIVVVDEADLLEGELMRFVEFRIGPQMVKELRLRVPKKGVHAATIEEWLREDVIPALEREAHGLAGTRDIREAKKLRIYKQAHEAARRVLGAGVEFGEGGWVRVYEDRDELSSFTLKPVKVDGEANKILWRHGKKWLLMSASLVSVGELVDSLGVEEAGLSWGEVHVPAVFGVDRRPVVASGIADMTRKGQEAGGVERLLDGIGVVLEEHVDDNILIHTHTYALAKKVVQKYGGHRGRKTWSYLSARDRETALGGFRRHGGVLVAPSMDRGIDLPDDLCRVQVVCKLPMPYLGDAQVGARMRTRGGELWYAVQTARGLIQMTGRGVRHEDDWCVTYILDSTFGKWKRKNKSLLPQWWQDAVKYVPGNQFEDEVRKMKEIRNGDT